MGSGGPGNIVHIDNLYVKPVPVTTNQSVLFGDFLIFDTGGYRTLLTTDFSADNTFLNLTVDNVVQALHDANNLNSTPAKDRVSQVSVAMRGTDWTTKMAAGVEPNRRVGISRLDSRTPVIAVSDVAGALNDDPTLAEILGVYKHKDFARLAETSVLNDDGVVSTGEV